MEEIKEDILYIIYYIEYPEIQGLFQLYLSINEVIYTLLLIIINDHCGITVLFLCCNYFCYFDDLTSGL